MAVFCITYRRTSTDTRWNVLSRAVCEAEPSRNSRGHPVFCCVALLIGQDRCLLSSIYSVRRETNVIHASLQMGETRHLVCLVWCGYLSVRRVLCVSRCNGRRGSLAVSSTS